MKKHRAEINPVKEAKEYAQKHNLKIENGYLYAFRNHYFKGHGMWNNTIIYVKEVTYSDWRCDLDKTEENSFGLELHI